MTLLLRDLLMGLHGLKLKDAPVLVHASLSSLGQVEDGAPTVVNALATVFKSILAPTFTYKSMLIPEVGPPDNGLSYGSGSDHNRMAEFFTPLMPADPLMGAIPEALRHHVGARRSAHPILSFAGINADRFLNAQTMDDPLAPLGLMGETGGWVILMGVNHTVNTSIHYAEKMAGRKTFVRWALTHAGVVECPGFPGCSAGFKALAPAMDHYSRKVYIGKAQVQAVPMATLFKVVIGLISQDPLTLLCQDEACGRCNAVRDTVQKETGV